VLLFPARGRGGSDLTLSYRFLSGRRGIAYTVSGRLTRTEFNSAYTSVLLPSFAGAPLFYVFFEFGDDVSQVEIPTDELRAMAAVVTKTSRHKSFRRVTAIYAKNDEPFARSREWRGFVAQIAEVEVFRERLEALNWLRKRVAEKFNIPIEH